MPRASRRRTRDAPRRPTTISEDLLQPFRPEILDRAVDYFERGLVDLPEPPSAQHSSANPTTGPWLVQVHGTRTYTVLVDLSLPTGGGCTCPAFRKFGPCKHLAASLLALAERGLLPGSDANGESAESSNWDQDDSSVQHPEPEWDDDDDDDDGDQWYQPTPTTTPDAPEDGILRAQRLLANRHAEQSPVDAVQRHVRQVHAYLGPHGAGAEVALVLALRERLRGGSWSVPRRLEYRGRHLVTELSTEDRQLFRRLRPHPPGFDAPAEAPRCRLPCEPASDELLLELAAAGRLHQFHGWSLFDGPTRHLRPIHAGAAPWTLSVVRTTLDDEICLHLRATRDDADAEPDLTEDQEPGTPLGHRLLLQQHQLSTWRAAEHTDPELVRHLLEAGDLRLPASEQELLAALLDPTRTSPPAAAPVGVVRLEQAVTATQGRMLPAQLCVRYGAQEFDAADPSPLFQDADGHWCARHHDAETQLVERFLAHGGVLSGGGAAGELRPRAHLPAANLGPAVRGLLAEGFEVFAAESRVCAGQFTGLQVRSDVDWFEVHGNVTFGEQTSALPGLLLAVQRHQGFVQLADGSFGQLPDRLAPELERLLHLGQKEGDHLRLARSQGWLLDALLADRGLLDEAARRTLDTLRERTADGLTPRAKAEPKGFGATLRPYQREGLGWFRFLQQLQVGGCLADDMGLGKTVQVLALLESRRRKRPFPGPSLVVVPTSLLFHWQREADRFAPRLRHLSFVGARRFWDHAEDVQEGFAGHHVVFTTYGTWRRDAAALQEIAWDYAVLDEATAIKNDKSQVAKAARLIRARHRLALSGTPVENHLGELWSLFEFLNPGMLGRAPAFRQLLASDPAAPDEGLVPTLRRAVRPFLLRRTKAQVLPDLPTRSEQVLTCELPTVQRRSYERLAQHYQKALLGELDQERLPDQLRFRVLEALLRLRQTACHPGLVDPERTAEDCAKFQVLLPMLEELREEGHKVLLFSAFPSFLKLLRPHLHAAGHGTAWIDGRTRRRKEEVDRFQSDPDCHLFLLSLKAAGHGLNLTAASYVFLLDPWWNPAAEAQAIDRTHRIGQDKPVHAYRLICRGTVEERVAELQQRKRKLADAVLGDEKSVLAGLSGEDVAFLLGG